MSDLEAAVGLSLSVPEEAMFIRSEQTTGCKEAVNSRLWKGESGRQDRSARPGIVLYSAIHDIKTYVLSSRRIYCTPRLAVKGVGTGRDDISVT